MTDVGNHPFRGLAARSRAAWLRGIAIVSLAFAATFACAGERLVVYFNEDSDRVKVALARLTAAVNAQVGRPNNGVRFEHVVVDYADPEGMRRAMRSAAARNPAAIVAAAAPIAQIAKEEAGSIPVVFGMHQDPVDLGLIASYRRPSGNLTGFTFYRSDEVKRLELLREIAPASRRLGVVTDAWWDQGPHYRHPSAPVLEKVARVQFGFEVEYFRVDTLEELAHLPQLKRARSIDAWYVAGNKVGFDHPEEFVHAIALLRRPAIYSLPIFTQKGGLISYQSVFDDPYVVWARMLVLILDGFPPGEIPVERPKTFELAINVKAAREQGIAIPRSLLLRATDFY